MPEDRITLKNMVFYASHGASRAERELGQRFEIDLTMIADLEHAASQDKLASAIDYSSVYSTVEEITTSRVFNLLESLAQSIAYSVLKQYPIDEIRVVVRKPRVPIRGTLDYVEVCVNRSRNNVEQS